MIILVNLKIQHVTKVDVFNEIVRPKNGRLFFYNFYMQLKSATLPGQNYILDYMDNHSINDYPYFVFLKTSHKN